MIKTKGRSPVLFVAIEFHHNNEGRSPVMFGRLQPLKFTQIKIKS